MVPKITFDVIFADRADYDLVRRGGVLSRAAVCRTFGIPESRISDYVEFDPALAIKFMMFRPFPVAALGMQTFSAVGNMGRCWVSQRLWTDRHFVSAHAGCRSGL